MDDYKDVDQGWAWVVLVACFIGNVINGFIAYSNGIFHVALLEHYQEDAAYTSLVGSTFSCLFSLFGIFVSLVVNATNCRVTLAIGGLLTTAGYFLSFFAKSLNVVFFTYGVLAGLGSGFTCTPTLIMIGYSFQKYRGIANGLVVSGAGFGMLASGPVSQLLIDTYGLHGAYLMTGGLSCHMIVIAALLRPSGSEKWHKRKRKETENTSQKCAQFRSLLDKSLYKNYSFVLIVFSSMGWNAAYAIVLLHLPNFAVVQGSPKTSAAMLLLMIGIGSSISRILSGLTSGTDSGIDPVLLKHGVLGITGVLTVCFPFYSTTYWQQALYAALFGIYSGGFIAFTVPILIEIVGLSKLSSAIGAVYFSGGIGCIIGPTVAGLIIDKTGSYNAVFYLTGVVFTVSSILVLLSTIWRPKDVGSEEDRYVTSVLFKGSNFLTGSALLTGSMMLDVRSSAQNMNSSLRSVGPYKSSRLTGLYNSNGSVPSNRSVITQDKLPVKLSRLAINTVEIIPLNNDCADDKV